MKIWAMLHHMSNHHHDHHNHHDHHHGAPSSSRALLLVAGLTFAFFIVELVGGALAKSLALMSDALHMLSDSTGLIIALIAVVIGRRKSTSQATYGYKRIEVLAALVNALSVTFITGWIVLEAIRRLSSHTVIDTGTTMVIAIIGLVFNIVGAVVLHGHSHEGANVKGAYLHILVDLGGSVAVIVSSLLIMTTGWMWCDTAVSVLLAVIILPRSLSLVRSTLGILMERVPKTVDVETIRSRIAQIDGVGGVHDVHVWSIDGQQDIATVHVVVDENVNVKDCTTLDRIQKVFHDAGIDHVTVQLEHDTHMSHELPCQH
ncbi:cation diffusion facilitator family transporter [Corynebacterium diphtheriae]|uniref:cation diffusion facilitator family transporter n=1 Tax=Corynebacterium diphtheriae TaxID=1717 RepID=UPI000245B1F3|nr:cation diffusion facilitator family transporter [Corynebacterium diphtheriae]AEX46285.1 cation-efflux system integral membrane protein [Corynebacterium diphtheriae INCA 402]